MAIPTRQHHSRLLLANCLLLMASFTLPSPWENLFFPGYLMLGVLMLRALGRRSHPGQRQRVSLRICRAVGAGALAVGGRWMLTPQNLRGTGMPVAVLWALFAVWSALRLIRQLAEERRVNEAVLRGALAGYLMLGLAGGQVFAAVETTAPGSFSGVELAQARADGQRPVWDLSFLDANYFALVTLTTTG